MAEQARVLIVTGGSRGIGAATAQLAAAQGYAVCLSYRRERDAAAQVVEQIEQAGGRAIAVLADVAREADVVSLFETCDRHLGRLSALVNNAGVLDTQMRVETMSAERIAHVFNVNVLGSFLCAREAVRRMSTRRGGFGGAIVNLSSAAARLGSPGQYVDYAASKGAVDTLTVGLAREVAEDGIRVNAVRPGIIATDIHASGGGTESGRTPQGVHSDDARGQRSRSCTSRVVAVVGASILRNRRASRRSGRPLTISR
jgi:NAD(P)-dependent dehydrogenase (short-subunit alcohol dehydrogenase family)